MKCAVCGRKFPAVIRPDKIPAGVGFVGKDGRTVDVRGACKGRPFIMDGRQKETRRQPGLLVAGVLYSGYACG